MNCREVNGRPICECLAGFVPKYPTSLGCVEPETDPCTKNPCGANADCTVVFGGQRRCKCRDGYEGDANRGCTPVVVGDPCTPNPCGNNAYCFADTNRQALCSCYEGYTGDPVSYAGCKPIGGCTGDDECPASQACIGLKCDDPCPGFCGFGASCRVQNHRPVCTCQGNYKGNPYEQCFPEKVPLPPAKPKPECLGNYECPRSKVCENNRCRDPCPSRCGVNALCSVVNHNVRCDCRKGYYGDPYTQCLGKFEIELGQL